MSCSDSAMEELVPILPSGKYLSITDSLKAVGAYNAIKKAYQLTDIQFTPKGRIAETSFKGGETYKGMIYSSVKEINTYVGLDVSFHTFMTAVNNPRSVLYTEIVNKPPYHGVNCSAYYGTVCSGLVSYALGLKYQLGSNQFPVSDLFEEVEAKTESDLQVADVLYQPGHVAMITGLLRDKKGVVQEVEYCEAVSPKCHRVILACKALLGNLASGKKRLFRYKYLERNQDYEPAVGFVDVAEEQSDKYSYNDAICTSKGDRACYREDDSVRINLDKAYEYLEIFKNDDFLDVIALNGVRDTTLFNLSYGDYKARVYDGKKFSYYTYWKVVDVNVSIDKSTNTVYFVSCNSIPESLEFCTKTGGRGSYDTYVHDLTDVEVQTGCSVIPAEKINTKAPFLKIHFKTDYGRIINVPIEW